MKSHQFFVVVLVSMFIGILSSYGQQTAEQLYQAGLYKEEIEGELDAAVKIYEKILRQYPNDRQVAAKTHLHIGICQEKLGNAAARKAYELVIREYADQAGIVSQAQKRLAALAVTARAAEAGAAKDLTLKKIYRGNANAVSISPDRTRLALIRPELSSRDIWIREIETGKEIRMTNHVNTSSDIVWSPDNQWIAFADQDRDINVVASDGGPKRTLFTVDPNAQNTAGIVPTGWTSDSRKVIFQVPSKGLFAIPAAGGALESICTFENPDEAKRYEAMTLSPDGRWIAYSAVQNGNTDIFIMSPAARIPVRITTNPAADRKPRWSPDGNWLAFTSSGTENPQIWAIKISPKGEPDGVPVQISKDSHVLGGDWTGDESIGFSAAFRTEHIFTANIDGTGETQVTQFASLNTAPRWSPNGDKIAFRSDYRKPLNTFQLWTVSSAGGTPRLVSEKDVGDFLWSDDGEKLFFRTKTGSNQSVSMEISSRGGEPKEIMPLPGGADVLGRLPDGQSIAYTFTVEPAQFTTTDEYLNERLSGIGIAPKGGGESRILIPADKKGIWYSDCRLDPEGKRIAYIMFDYAQYNKEGMYSIWTMEVNGGTPRQITRGGEYHLCWSPDAKWIVFEKRIRDMEFELYKVPANGGEPVKMNIRGRSPEFSPDGKKIAYSRRTEGGYEYWLVENFAAQSQVKLAALGGSEGLSERRILTDATDVRGVLTENGKYIRYLDRGTGDVVQFEVASGKISRIKNTGPWGDRENYVEGYVFSHDGKQIAYDRFTTEGKPQLRIRNLDCSDLRTLYHEGVAMAYDWSPDGGSILALCNVSGTDNEHELALISLADGSVRVLKRITFFPYMLTKATFSPDGRFIAFSLVNEGNPTNNDLFLMTADGRNEVVVAGHPAEDELVAWTPDGKSLLFRSDRSGTWDIWTVPISEGKQQGEPELLKKDFGMYSQVLGFAPDGSLYYRTITPLGQLYFGELNIETGKVIEPPAPVMTRYNGAPSRITWSPDGKSLLYISGGRAMGNGNNNLTIRSAETGEERFLPQSLRKIWNIGWAPDNRNILAMGMTVKENALFQIDAETGRTTKLANGRGAPHISRDGKTMIYMAEEGLGSLRIKIRNLETGEETTGIKAGNQELRAFSDLSPDGREVVFQDDSAVFTVSIKGGEPQKLFKGPSKYYSVKWSWDGSYIIAQAIDTRSGWYLSPGEIWRIPVKGGTPLRLDLSIPKIEFFALHPDNRRFAFSIFEGTRAELWVIENILPMEKIKPNVSTMTVTRVLEKADVTGRVSADGRFLSFTDWESGGNVAIRNLATGDVKLLTNNGDLTGGGFAEPSMPSPDGKSVAYAWYSDGKRDLCLVGSDGSGQRVLKAAGNGILHILPLTWSPDNKQLLAEFIKNDGTRDIMLVNITDGSAKLLKATGKDISPGGSFSPDGKYIAWSVKEGISLFELKTGTESLLFPDKTEHSVLCWTPDGKYILFSSERSGSKDAWLIRMTGGKVLGEPVFVRKNWGSIPMGFTHSGAFYFGADNNILNIRTVELNPEAGKVVSELQSAFRHGNMRAPDWSPDGKLLAGITGGMNGLGVVIRSLENGEEREIRTEGWTIGMGGLRWTPDGKAVVVTASAAGKGNHLVRIEIQTGNVTSLMQLPALSGWPRYCLSKDGSAVLYVMPSPDGKESQLVSHNLKSAEEKTVFSHPGLVAGAVSPDGKQLLLIISPEEGKQALLIMPSEGGETRELARIGNEKEVPFWGCPAWTPDSRHVVFFKGIKGKERKRQLWRVPVEGGELQPLGLEVTDQLVGSLRIHTDGRTIAIDDVKVNLELWVMENFLPK